MTIIHHPARGQWLTHVKHQARSSVPGTDLSHIYIRNQVKASGDHNIAYLQTQSRSTSHVDISVNKQLIAESSPQQLNRRPDQPTDSKQENLKSKFSWCQDQKSSESTDQQLICQNCSVVKYSVY